MIRQIDKKIVVSDIEIEIIKKRMKNMHLHVLPPNGKVRVTAPDYTDDKNIYLFVLSKLGWIKKQISIFENRPKQPELFFINGETHYLWGREYRLEIKTGKKPNRVEVEDGKLILFIKEYSTYEKRSKIMNEFYRKQLKIILPFYIKKWENIIGVRADSINIKNMRTRWGTCNVRDKKIWMNLQLAKKPFTCLEYVVVHELVHLLERNHGAGFKKHMDEFLPNWKATRNELNNVVLQPQN